MANRFNEEKDVDIRADDPARPEWERDAKQAAELAEDAGVKAGQAVGKAAAEASRKLRRATAAYERTAAGASDAYRSVREYALDHPGTAVAVTFGAGILCGMSLTRRRAIAEYRLGMVPTIAIALASAVLDVFSTRR